jgi:hypothetical protein
MLIASLAGPRRVNIRPFRPFDITLTESKLLVSNASAPALYVEIRLLSGPSTILIGPIRTLSAETAKTVNLAVESFISAVLLEGEELWVRGTGAAQLITRVQVGSIQV